MNSPLLWFRLAASVTLASCSVKLAAVADKTPEQVQAAYTVTKDVPYGTDREQTLDVYRSAEAPKRGAKNYTVVFLHGGGYYLSDKAKEERYIQPYLKKGVTVVNLNYRLKRGIPMATEDLTQALNFLAAHRDAYPLNLERVVLTGFSAGAHIGSLVAVTANDPTYPYPLAPGIRIAAVVNFSGPVGGLDVVENVFMNHPMPVMKEIGLALFPETTGYAPKEVTRKYEPLTYWDPQDPPFFIWQGGKDDQVPPVTFTEFVARLQQNHQKNTVLFVPEGNHSPSARELEEAYKQIFPFLDKK
ncbi:alpha/beta hydrolase [Hymenobacter glacialis]|uniref:alpha/beta hydrolase n=1 Tax=Hymenobacter glacialis TaxID=1908236 RepID=UPI0009F392A2|nr:alpha/beta hydrolase [Hymenobacter glacialis]